MSEKRELSRSENARQRRAQRTVRELQETKQRAMRPAAPAVTSRVSTRPAMAAPKRGTKKRRFNIAFGLHEVRLHKPGVAAMRFSWDLRRTAAVIAFLLGVVVYLALSLPYLHVSSATVLGNNRLSAEEINSVLGVTGQSIFTVQPDEVKTRLLMNYPELSSAEVKVYLPNHVYVTVTERQPVILWQQNGGMTWIDSTGVAFLPRGVVAGLVLVDGLGMPSVNVVPPTADPLSPPPYLQQDLVDAILVLAPSVPADSTMIFDPGYGLGWKDNRGWKAFFGTSLQDMPLKVRVYQSLVDSLLASGKTPAFISVAYPDAPFYRMTETRSPQSANDGQ